MNVPEIDLELLERRKRQNQRERMEFIEQYAAWLEKRRTKNGVGSKPRS